MDVPIILCMCELGEVSKSHYVKWILNSYATTYLVFRYGKIWVNESNYLI